MESFRKQDMKAETVLGEFMDNAFYSKLRDKDGNKVGFKRVTDAVAQRKGIDVIIEGQGKRFLIDEKATLYYSNMMIPTFAFEVSSIQKSSTVPVEGWLVNDALETNYYMLIWPNIKCKRNAEGVWERVPLDRLHRQDFTIVEAMLIRKKKILEFLEENGWPKERIIAFANEIREYYRFNTENIKLPVQETDGFYFYYTAKLAEKPINIVIRKEILKKIADASYFISNEYYSDISLI